MTYTIFMKLLNSIMRPFEPWKQNTSNAIAALCILAFPVTYMTVRHSVHVALFTLLLLALIYFAKSPRVSLFQPNQRSVLIAFLAFAGLALATLISQAFRMDFHFPPFDGPSRLLAAGVVFLYLRHLQISLIRILEVAIPLGLIVVLAVLILHPVTYWGTRFATYFVDPNTLGSQTFILAIITLLSLRFSSGKGVYLVALKIIGSIAGIYVSIHAGSRGGWISAPFILLMLILVLLSEANHLQGEARRKKIGQIMLFLGLAFIAAAALFASSDFLLTRVIDGYNEIRNWLTGEFIDSSAGLRLSMWKISLQLSQNSFLFGYGDKEISSVLKGSMLDVPVNQEAISTLIGTGPHSDILSKLLSIGAVGLFAYFAVLAVPFVICFAHRCSDSVDVRQASQTALYYITGVLICGLSNEQLSLKYLCSFYGLMIAVFLAEAMRVKPSKNE